MDFSKIFGVFSRRDKSTSEARIPLTREFKNRVVQLCVETFDDYDFWRDVHRSLQYHLGRPIRTTSHLFSADHVPRNHTLDFLGRCSDEHFLDFVEFIFQSETVGRRRNWEVAKGLVRDINTFLRVDDLPYSLTAFVGVSDADGSYITHRVVERPRIIRRANDVLHETALEPALTFLTNPAFASANKEFLDALEDYRRGKYEDCVTKCASSLESVMKIICDSKKWPHQQTDKASKLANIILPRTGLAPSLKHPIIVVATLRNQFSSAHGAGTQPRVVPQHLAKFAINATASVILLLVEETNP